MAEVTVCIPAYRAHRFIAHTLATVQAQTFEDFEVEVAIEPVEHEATLQACAPFLADPRFRARVNEKVSGYAGNVGALLGRVTSPLFVVLPHDDGWHPQFLQHTYDALAERPEAVGAYPDVWCYAPDGLGAGVVRHFIEESGLVARISSWLFDGASGNPWHGLTRASVLTREFPDNEYRAFAVECEWVLHLLKLGPLVRAPDALYIKRQPSAVNPHSVSSGWVGSIATLPGALAHHRRRLLASLPERLDAHDRRLLRLATEAAMLVRAQEFADGRWGLDDQQHARADQLLGAADELDPSIGLRLEALVRLALSRHSQAIGDPAAAELQARRGLEADPESRSLAVQLGWLLAEREAFAEAVPLTLRSSAKHPNDPHVRLLWRYLDERFEHRMRVVGDDEAAAEEATGSPWEAPEDGRSGGRLYFRLRASEAEVAVARADLAAAVSRAARLEAELQDTATAYHRLALALRTARLRSSVLASQHTTSWLGRLMARRYSWLSRLGWLSPLFDADWYRRTHRGVPRTGPGAWWHWTRLGWRVGADPNPLFDTRWYLARYPDVRRAGVDPLTHYSRHGSAEGRAPGPAFDPAAYLARYPDVQRAGLDPLAHYLLFGAAEGRVITPVPEDGSMFSPDDRPADLS